MNTNVKVIGLTRLGIKPEFTAPKTDALTTWPSELLTFIVFFPGFDRFYERTRKFTVRLFRTSR